MEYWIRRFVWKNKISIIRGFVWNFSIRGLVWDFSIREFVWVN